MTYTPQIFTCLNLRELGGKACADFSSPEGEVFLVWQSKYFTPQAGKKYIPVVRIAQIPYISPKNGRAYNKRAPVISWEELA